jgi:hypothetical protein
MLTYNFMVQRTKGLTMEKVEIYVLLDIAPLAMQ